MILQICIIFVVLLISRVHKVVNVSWWVIVNCHHQDEDEYDDHSTLILRVVTVGRGFAETILWHHFMHHNKSYLVICHILSSYLVISICYTLSSYLVLCHILSSYYVISICFILSSVFVTFCHHIWSFVTSHHHIMSSVFVTFVISICYILSSYLVLCHILSSYYVISICYILSSVFVTFCHHIWSFVTSWHHIVSSVFVTFCHQCLSSYLAIRINFVISIHHICHQYFHSGISQISLTVFFTVVFHRQLANLEIWVPLQKWFSSNLSYYNIMEESKRCTMLY